MWFVELGSKVYGYYKWVLESKFILDLEKLSKRIEDRSQIRTQTAFPGWSW